MKRVLFVDDEPNILEGLRRMLHDHRGEWDMHFATSGAEALEILAQTPCDVVVSDMRMPGMSGAELLTEVMRRQPGAVRIILSGHSDRELILKTVGPAHQYLSKPCDAETLRVTVARACALRDMLRDEALRTLTAQMTTLPSLPALYVELMEEIQSDDPSIQRVGEIIAKDLGMTAKILQLVNSAFFGLPRRITNPAQAASLLGLDVIRALVLSIHVFTQFAKTHLPGFSVDGLFQHSLAVGSGAQAIARAEGLEPRLVDEALMAGTLHDAGRLVLAANLPERYAEAARIAREERVTLWKAELAVFGATHAEVGAYLLGLWGLPDSIIEALAHHHSPRLAPGQGFRTLTAVHVADAIEHECTPSESGYGLARLDEGHLADLGLSGRLPVWREILRKTLSGAQAA